MDNNTKYKIYTEIFNHLRCYVFVIDIAKYNGFDRNGYELVKQYRFFKKMFFEDPYKTLLFDTKKNDRSSDNIIS